eukprot:8998966-Pyramimonas_sp.AAC.1
MKPIKGIHALENIVTDATHPTTSLPRASGKRSRGSLVQRLLGEGMRRGGDVPGPTSAKVLDVLSAGRLAVGARPEGRGA